jgi:leader peptidase (prepilin peptidase)/N-methyltransferase
MQIEQILLTLIFFLYGIVIGSFLNVCIYRIPLKENIAKSRSHCMTCGHNLAWYDLFPLFSWLFLRGKCRYCGAKISGQYPLVEAINGIGYVWILMVSGFCLNSILYCLTFSALIVITVIDWRTFEIPIGLNIFILVMGIIATAFDLEHIVNHLIGMVCVSGILAVILYASKGTAMGGGDVRLMAVAGLLLGWQKILLALALGSIIGSVIHIMRMKLSGVEHRLAFGPYLSAGIVLAMLYGEQMINWYMGFYIH